MGSILVFCRGTTKLIERECARARTRVLCIKKLEIEIEKIINKSRCEAIVLGENLHGTDRERQK